MRGIEDAIACGEQIDHVSLLAKGTFEKWLKEEFVGAVSTGYKYRRLYRNRHKLNLSAGEVTLTIDSALRELSAPSDASKNPEPAVEEGEADDAEVVEDTVVDLEPEDSEDLPDLNEELEQLRKEKLAAEKAKKDEEKKRKAEAKRRREAEKKLKEDSKELEVVQKTLRERFEQQLAEVHARYGIEETPGIFEVDDKHWEAALEKTRGRREEEALKILKDFFPTVSKMRKYEPDDAARACLKWPSEARSKEAIREIAEWMTEVSEEMDALTTKGILRAVKE